MGQVESERVDTRRGADTFTSYITNQYGSGTGYALGAVVSSTSQNVRNGNDGLEADTSTTNEIGWHDGAVTTKVVYDSDSHQDSNDLFYTTYKYTGSGHLRSAQINDGRERTVTYTNDVHGQALRRDEKDRSSDTSGDPHEIWYRFGGKQMGYTGNEGTLDTGYAASIENRQKVPVADPGTVSTGAFRNGLSSVSHNDFDLGPDRINSYSQGSTRGNYTVRGGDTLGSVAAQLWGDSSLWYKLAEANGLTASATLIEGQNLHVPHGVMRSTYNASTFKPYGWNRAYLVSRARPCVSVRSSGFTGTFARLVTSGSSHSGLSSFTRNDRPRRKRRRSFGLKANLPLVRRRCVLTLSCRRRNTVSQRI